MQRAGRGGSRHLGRLLAVLLAAQFMNNIDIAVANVASPAIHRSLGASGVQLQFIVSGYVMAYAVLLVTGARLGDMRGYRRVFTVGLAVFVVASLACGLAPDANLLIASRLVEGAGAALMVPQVLTGIQLHFTGPSRGRALAYYAVALSGGAVAGQTLGGVLLSADLFGTAWRPLFLINVPIGLVLLAGAVRYLPPDSSVRHGQARIPAGKLDLPGVAVLIAAVVLLTVPLVLGRQEGWPTWACAALAASAPALVLFVFTERRVAAQGGSPLLNLQIMTWPRIAWGLAAQMAVQASYYALLFILALYLQQGLGYSPLYSGLALLSWVIAFGVAGLGVRRLAGRYGTAILPAGYLLLGLDYAALGAAAALGDRSGALLVILLGIGGLGLGTGFNSMVAHLAAAVPSRYAADFSGIHNTVLQVAGTLGVAGFGTLYLALVPCGGEAAAMHGFSLVCAVLAGSALVATVAAVAAARAGP